MDREVAMTTQREIRMNTRNREARSAGDFVSAARDERGLSTVEYVVLLVLIVGAAVALWVNIGQDVRDKLTMVNSSFAAVTYGSAASQNPGSPEKGSPAAQPAASPAPQPVVPGPQPAPAPAAAPGKAKEDR